MKLKNIIEELQKIYEKHGNINVVYASDNEGNYFQSVNFTPSVGFFKANEFYMGEDIPERKKSMLFVSIKRKKGMAKITVHEKDCIHFLKKPWTDVHKCLDQCAKDYPPEKYAEYHRSFFHNSYGLMVIKALFGEEGYIAALIHLYRDWTYQDPKKCKLEHIVEAVNRRILPNMNQFKYMELPYVHI